MHRAGAGGGRRRIRRAGAGASRCSRMRVTLLGHRLQRAARPGPAARPASSRSAVTSSSRPRPPTRDDEARCSSRGGLLPAPHGLLAPALGALDAPAGRSRARTARCAARCASRRLPQWPRRARARRPGGARRPRPPRRAAPPAPPGPGATAPAPHRAPRPRCRARREPAPARPAARSTGSPAGSASGSRRGRLGRGPAPPPAAARCRPVPGRGSATTVSEPTARSACSSSCGPGPGERHDPLLALLGDPRLVLEHRQQPPGAVGARERRAWAAGTPGRGCRASGRPPPAGPRRPNRTGRRRAADPP